MEVKLHTIEEKRAIKYYKKRLKKVKARWRNVKKQG